MSQALIKKLNAITHDNLSDPMVVRMRDWNEAMDGVRSVLDELTAAKAEIERLQERLDSYICAVSTMDIVTQKAYVSGAATVHNIKQIVAEAAEKGGDDEKT